MPELTVNSWVSRERLFKGVLQINDGSKFVLGKSLDPGALSWRKQVIESPFYPGRHVVHEVKDAIEMSLVVFALGETHAQLGDNISELLEAFTEQSEYEVWLNVNTRPYAWICERADYEIGFATETLSALNVPVKFSINRYPYQLAGPI